MMGCRLETIQTTALLRSARILKRVLETRGDLLSLRLQWKTIDKDWSEKLANNNNNNKYFQSPANLKQFALYLSYDTVVLAYYPLN